MSELAHILLVDDDPDLLRLLTIRLKAGNYRVTAVGSAEAALARLAVELPALVITDVQLPGRDGLALFDEIRRQHAALPVILLTAHGTIPDAVDATARGAFAYLTKPFDGKLLMEKVAYAINLSTVMPAPASGDVGSVAGAASGFVVSPFGVSACANASGETPKKNASANAWQKTSTTVLAVCWPV